MSGVPAVAAPASNGLRGVLRAWLKACSWGSARPGAAGANDEPPVRVRVLVADDNPVNLMLMSSLMEVRGIVPLLAADGAEAVALACELHFDLVLMDLQMPILDGLGATSAIRRFEVDSARPAVPVLAYSSAVPTDGVLARHGLNGSLLKPCGDQALDDCLRRWCPTYRPAPFGSGAGARQADREHRA